MSKRDLAVGVRVSDEFIAAHPDADVSATEVSINLVLVAELLFSRMDALASQAGLSRGGFNLLQVVAGSEEPLTPTEVAERLVVKGATVTGLVDTLVRHGLVERHPHPIDRRRVLVTITDAGRRQLAASNAVLLQRDRAWMACLSSSERETLIRSLGKLQAHLRTMPAEARHDH
jgi:DNA-binding MarR family transcriptional regulator